MYVYDWIFKKTNKTWSHAQTFGQKMVNPKDTAGNSEEGEGEEESNEKKEEERKKRNTNKQTTKFGDCQRSEILTDGR